MDDRGDELERLRRAAYSRTGTAEDLRRLAALEPIPEEPASDPVTGDIPREPVDEERPQDDAPTPQPRRRRVVLPALIGFAVGAIIATAVTAGISMASSAGAPWPGESSLAVFDREAAPIDDPSRLEVPIEDVISGFVGSRPFNVGEIELRWIGAPGGYGVYAARWDAGGTSTVCVVVESSLQAASSCVPESAFRQEGIRIEAFGMDLRWGPHGTELWANSSG